MRGGGLVSSSLFAIKTGFTAQEPQFYRGKHEVDRRSRLVTLKYKGYCWSGCYTVAESVGQQSFNSALGMAQIMGQIIGPATGNARLVRYEEQGLTKPAIYAFLGLATLPRFQGRADGPHPRAANPLHLLPREIVRHIARFAYRDRYHAHWIMFGNPFTRLAAVAIDVRMRDIWPQWSGRSLRAIPGRRVAERRPRPSPRLPRPRGFGGRSVHPVVRHAADPTRDTGGGEPPYDCCGASRRWFIVRGGQCHYPELD